MNSSVISDAKYHELNISFSFESHEDKLIINAKSENIVYEAVKLFDPDLDFDDLKQALNSKHFKIVNKSPESIKLKIGLLNLEFKNKEKQNLQELKDKVQDLTQKLNTQIQKNAILQKITHQLKVEVDSMTTKFADLSQKFQERFTLLETTVSSQFNNKIQTLQSNLKQEMDKVATLTTLLEETNKKVQQTEKTQSQIQKDMYQSNKDFAKIQRNHFLPKIQLKKLREHSKIVKSAEEQQIISNFFENKTIKRIQLLFRASEHNFLIKKFHEKCDDIPNTLTLCETAHQRKIGGYTPLVWKSTEEGSYKTDESGESFLFSLTYNEKFILQKKELAIGHSKKFGPSFGGFEDFTINDKADDGFSFGAVNNNYYNQNYKKDDSKSLIRFHGNNFKGYPTFFRTLEWEVWQIEFD